MNRILCTLALSAILSPALAQQYDYTTPVSWSASPALHKIPSTFTEASALTILDERSIEYKKQGDDLVVVQTIHKIVHIKDDKGIEMFNKMYLPVHEGGEVGDIKARTITASGKVLDVTPDKIQSTEEDGAHYRQFALDGVEKGAEVEYSYTEKRPFYLFGSEFYQNGAVPCLEARFLLITPSHLRFSAKGYNGINVSADSLIGDKRIIVGQASNIKDLPDEKYAFKDQYLARIDFKLSYNLSSNDAGARMYTWKDLGKRAYSFYTDRNEKDDKALAAFASSLPAPEDTSLAGRIASLENFLKSHIDIDKKLTSENGDQIPQIVATKTANDEGIVRLFTGLLDRLGISYELVLAADRDGIPMDPELENWDRAANVLIYFPDTKAYIDPTQQELRYPIIRPTLAGIKGLYLKQVQLGNFKTAVATFYPISIAPWDSSASDMEADLRFNETMDTLLVKGSQILKGYSAAQYRPVYAFLPKEKQDEINKDIARSVGNCAATDVTNVTVVNPALTDCFNNKPLVISSDNRNADLIETAGSRILLKFGDIIGPQTEMYQERPRQMPAEMPFPHQEFRTITLHIPEGYTIKNVKDLNFNVSYPAGDSPTMSFTSDYSLNGSILVVHIKEVYRSLVYPLSQFEDFKKIINTSADFNKVVLVLEKSGT
jgi:hypothetical protein